MYICGKWIFTIYKCTILLIKTLNRSYLEFPVGLIIRFLEYLYFRILSKQHMFETKDIIQCSWNDDVRWKTMTKGRVESSSDNIYTHFVSSSLI